MKAFFLAALAVVAASAQKCNPPTTFEARGTIVVATPGSRGEGHYGWAHDMEIKESVEEMRFHERHHKHLDLWELEDYSHGFRYFEDQVNKTCIKKPLDSRIIPNIWGFLANSTLLYSMSHRGRTVDVWGQKHADGSEIGVACFVEDLTRPVLLFRKRIVDSVAHRLHIDLLEFRGAVTNTTIFNKLPNCA